MENWRGFGSDNHSGAHPSIISALAEANVGHALPYGDDPWTARAKELVRAEFGDVDVAFVFNGTGANVVGIGCACRPWESVSCSEDAHINTDECAAPERVAGVKLVPVAHVHGKITPDTVRPALTGFGFEHHAQPKVVSISQASELGTVYSQAEVRALADLAHEHGMLLHMDGARIGNAAASLGCSLAEASVASGVDILSLGGTKNGMLFGEAVVLAGDARTADLAYVRKGSAQLPSKCRFIAAQFSAMLEGGLWRDLASHANEMAKRLAEGAAAAGVTLVHPVDANEIFAELPAAIVPELEDRFRFYTWIEDAERPVVRWVTSWDTTAEDVDALLSALSAALS